MKENSQIRRHTNVTIEQENPKSARYTNITINEDPKSARATKV